MGQPFPDEPLASEGPHVLGEVAYIDGGGPRDRVLRHPPRDLHRIPELRELEEMEENPFLRGEPHRL